MIRRSQMLTTAALVAVCALPPVAGANVPPPSSIAASAADQYQDLRSPDTRDAARAAITRGYLDLRSPDARDAAVASEMASSQDLRSPDARDAGREPSPVQIPEPVVEIREVPSGGFDWGDAGIGAAALLALLSIAGGLTLMAFGRRRRQDVEAPAH
jgi:hypothetical protein